MKTPEELAEEYADSLWESPKYYQPEVTEGKNGFLAGYQAAKEEANFSTPAKWISVKERLPETNELCIVNTEWRGVVPATYGNESWIFDEGLGWSEKPLSYALHWMPLPEPPKKEK